MVLTTQTQRFVWDVVKPLGYYSLRLFSPMYEYELKRIKGKKRRINLNKKTHLKDPCIVPFPIHLGEV